MKIKNKIHYRKLIICLLMTILLAGCSQDSLNGKIPKDAKKVKVQRVVDGDTIVITGKEKVRLLGVDTPESVKPDSPVEPYGKEASNFTKKMLEGKTVYLTYDVQPKDKYGRTLAFLYLEDGTFFNELLVKEGYAQVLTIPPNVKYQERFLEAERYARENDKGLWGISR